MGACKVSEAEFDLDYENPKRLLLEMEKNHEIRDVVEQHILCIIGNGCSTKLWLDK